MSTSYRDMRPIRVSRRLSLWGAFIATLLQWPSMGALHAQEDGGINADIRAALEVQQAELRKLHEDAERLEKKMGVFRSELERYTTRSDALDQAQSQHIARANDTSTAASRIADQAWVAATNAQASSRALTEIATRWRIVGRELILQEDSIIDADAVTGTGIFFFRRLCVHDRGPSHPQAQRWKWFCFGRNRDDGEWELGDIGRE
jgi:hypothetical protein